MVKWNKLTKVSNTMTCKSTEVINKKILKYNLIPLDLCIKLNKKLYLRNLQKPP